MVHWPALPGRPSLFLDCVAPDLLPASAAPADHGAGESMAAAGTWGILRNALQEFPAIRWAGIDADPCTRTAHTLPMESDAFGMAAKGVKLCDMATICRYVGPLLVGCNT